MELAESLKRTICSLFEVHADTNGMHRIVTPLEYPGTGDRVVVRVRPQQGTYVIDENGEACLYASMAGGDVESAAVGRWSREFADLSPASLCDDEVIRATALDERSIAPYVFRVAEAAQQLYGIATSQAERQSNSDFKERLSSVLEEIAGEIGLTLRSDVELPIPGRLVADHVIEASKPLIIIGASNATHLLEAEVIYMQYKVQKISGYVLAIAESQKSVTKKQFERANYYTDKTVAFDADNLKGMIASSLQ
ncbi:hypothetical protein NOV72_01347 [Caballeronia novacaledonica]|uniref:DUF1828 domain-containing protein n=1 Tax=Caballeronia novacaledonica TaxID=1544861 RepID=A0A2U3I1X3_9BURK|nr:hypothetical protein [Caballeronia novacaledonica]SPB14099.1 hypothetical protein NOV72_01347 [Caballeronia novacaledonica]